MLFNNTNMRTAMAYTNAVGDKVYPVIVDIKKGIKSTEEILFVSSDINTGVLSVAFIQGNDTYNVEGAEVICSIMRPDTTTLEIPCNAVNDNIVEVPLGVNGTSQDGVYSFDFKVFKGEDKIVGTPIMNYSVSLSISNDLVVEEDDRLPVLTMLITQVNELKEETRETINQSNVATEASKEATANAISATANANAVSERVSQETSEAISRVDNTIVELNNTVGEKISELDNAKTDMTTTVSNKVNEVETRFNTLTSSQQQDAEVIDARDGETSLKARLDRDIEKAKQVYVELEGNHISTESSTGAIEDLEILGNTVQDPNNLADIKSVGELQEDGTYKMSILSRGKNLFDSTFEIGGIFWTTGKDNNSEIDRVRTGYIRVKPNTEYIISEKNLLLYSVSHVFYLNKNKEFISLAQPSNGTPKISFSTPSDCFYIRLLRMGQGTSTDIYTQLEEGAVATPYEPYQENKCDILLPCQLEKVGDVSDRLYYDDVEKAWCIEKNVETKVLNGSEEGWYGVVTGDYFRCTIQNFNVSAKKAGMCDKLKINSRWDAQEKGIFIDHNLTITLPLSEANSIETFKQWLKTNLPVIKYENTTEKFIALPRNTQIQLNSFFGTTHVYMESGEVEGTIKCKIPKSLGATVQSLNNKTDILSDRMEAIEGLKDSQNMKYETDKGYLVCKETKNGVIDDLKIEGKTLVNLLKQEGSWAVGGNTTTCHCFYELLKPLEVGKTYTYFYFNLPNTITQSYLGTASGDIILVFWGAIQKAHSFIATEERATLTHVVPHFKTNGTDTLTTSEIENIKVVLLEGDHTQNPPSYFEGLMSVGQDVDKIEVLSRKEDGNLFDGEIYKDSNKYWFIIRNVKNNSIYIDLGQTCSYFELYECGELSDCYIKYKDWKVIKTVSNQQATITTVNKNHLIIAFDTNFFTSSEKLNKVIVNKGDAITSCKEYQSDKKQILFYNENGELEPIQELHEWDSIEKHSDNKWYYHKRSGKVVLNGSEEWKVDGYATANPNTQIFSASINDRAVGISNVICDKFLVYDYCHMNDIESMSGFSNANAIRIRISNSKLITQDVEGFKQWLQANNVTVVYQLAQEEVYELAPLHLDSYANETLILCNSGAISPKMEFSITSHINELVKSQGERISLLEEKMYKALKQVLAGDMYSLAELLYPEDFVEENPENEIMLLPIE